MFGHMHSSEKAVRSSTVKAKIITNKRKN
jgi:hypothetical protein